MKLRINIIDAFTDTRFKGNSAAVIMTAEWLSDELMQSIATENNLSETAYLVKNQDDSYTIRWFSPITEIDFCGHATLASAFVIFSGSAATKCIKIFAKSVGMMDIIKTEDGYIQMDFPNRKPSLIESAPESLLNGLSITPNKVLINNQAYFAVYEDEDDVLNVTQNKEYLVTLAPRDVVVTAASTEEYDFISRYFWPANGGDEDPVTGSIHTGLAPFWAEHLNKQELIAYQVSSRGGVLVCKVTEDRVVISGKAVQYLEGYIQV
jgi:PhzF family phenazine biosynthesis protein